ncbi:MAG: hypothetical protein L0K86_06810 [Actinomycetia bacterium]|nr:hypothetical protein [Actinomycetes bacterium]
MVDCGPVPDDPAAPGRTPDEGRVREILRTRIEDLERFRTAIALIVMES